MALGPNPHPPSSPQRKPTPRLPELCSFPRVVQPCSAGFLYVLLMCSGLLQMLRSPGVMPGILDFSTASIIVLQPRQASALRISSLPCPPGRCQELRCGLGAEFWHLSTARLTAGFPASTCLTIPGSGSIAYS